MRDTTDQKVVPQNGYVLLDEIEDAGERTTESGIVIKNDSGNKAYYGMRGTVVAVAAEGREEDKTVLERLAPGTTVLFNKYDTVPYFDGGHNMQFVKAAFIVALIE